MTIKADGKKADDFVTVDESDKQKFRFTVDESLHGKQISVHVLPL